MSFQTVWGGVRITLHGKEIIQQLITKIDILNDCS